jgi:predicted P-loop ATPase
MANERDHLAQGFYRQPSNTRPDFGGAAKTRVRHKANGLGPEPPPAEPTGPDAAGWLARCHTTKTGGPLGNLHNALLPLRLDPAWHGQFRYDDMACGVVTPMAPLQDCDGFRVLEWMQTKGLRRMGIEAVHQAIEIVAREHRFHPLRDWLGSLRWDGQPRLASWLQQCLGVPDTEYHQAIGAMFLIAMAARIYNPGCKADYMLVLEGAQGDEKSEVCATLGGEYFSNHLPRLDADEIRVSAHLRGKWLIEIAELSAFSKADASLLKSFLTRQVEQFTPKYARAEVTEPRQCLFIATTNDDTYLKDDTGGRRFWPIKCGNVDLDRLRAIRSQLFAEAVVAYHKPTQWWPNREFERRHIAPQQASRLIVDEWEQAVRYWLVGQTRVSLLSVAELALDLPKARFGPAEQRRLASVMRLCGWKLVRTETARVWEPLRSPTPA